MPFKSQAQRGMMYSQHPKLAKEMEAKTPKGKKLPYKVKKTKTAFSGMKTK
jgi:tRNA A37 threonylcarbamoyltransferase TsaD